MSIEVYQVPNIPGLLVFSLEKHKDERGSFQEKFHKQKMVDLGLPKDFNPVQQNVSDNPKKGTIRGLHAEPWHKYISVICGKVFCAFVDLRPGKSRGKIFTIKIDSNKGIFIPKDVANSFQTLTRNVAYSYLVTKHWSPQTEYKALSIYDTSLDIKWPISLDKAIVSDKDKHNPYLKDLKK